MTELECELKAACKLAVIQTEGIPNRAEILQTIKDKFVKGDPRAWWTSLNYPPQIHEFEGNTGYLHLEELMSSSDEDVWFIADEDNEFMHLYEMPLKKAKDVIGACRYFEYYVVAKDLSWLMAENDHGKYPFTPQRA